jgi:ribose transport system permease protein
VFKKFGKEIGVFALLVVLCVFVGAKNHVFFGAQNLQNNSRLVGEFVIFGIGAGLVIISGGIDLTVGSMLALLGILLSIAMTEKHWSGIAAVIAILIGGTALGSIHGFLITRIKLQPFIVTLCGLLLYRGLSQYIASDETKGFADSSRLGWLYTAASGNFLAVPVPFLIMIVVAIVTGILLVGRNEEAARYSGINTKRVIATAYVIAGFLTALAAILIAVDTGSISPSVHGNSYELYGIAAAVLGGCSLKGGEGSIIGVIIGTMLLRVLQNLIILLNIPSSLNFAVLGAVILIGVIVDQLVHQRSAAKA